MNKRLIQNTAVVTAALGAVLVILYTNTNWLSPTVNAEERERCYGISRIKQNDCATSTHSCAYQSTTSKDPEEFIMLPKGICDRIVGGKSA